MDNAEDVETVSDIESTENGPDCIEMSLSSEPKPTLKKPPLFVVVPNYIPKIPQRTAPGTCLTHLGSVNSVVDGCVIIKAQSSAPVVDAGTAVFLEGGEPLGEIYETFGPVSTPLYIVILPNSSCLTTGSTTTKKKYTKKTSRRRYQHVNGSVEPSASPPVCEETTEHAVATVSIANATDDAHGDDPPKAKDVCEHSESPSIPETPPVPVVLETEPACDTTTDTGNSSAPAIPSVKPGDTVYFVKDDPELTIPVFYSQLIQTKGSDASWIGDTEPPPEVLEFSDDEQERLHKRQLRAKRSFSSSSSATDKPVPRHRANPFAFRGQSRGFKTTRMANSNPRQSFKFNVDSQQRQSPAPKPSIPQSAAMHSRPHNAFNPQPCYGASSFSYNHSMQGFFPSPPLLRTCCCAQSMVPNQATYNGDFCLPDNLNSPPFARHLSFDIKRPSLPCPTVSQTSMVSSPTELQWNFMNHFAHSLSTQLLRNTWAPSMDQNRFNFQAPYPNRHPTTQPHCSQFFDAPILSPFDQIRPQRGFPQSGPGSSSVFRNRTPNPSANSPFSSH